MAPSIPPSLSLFHFFSLIPHSIHSSLNEVEKQLRTSLYSRILINEPNIPWPLGIPLYKLLIPRWSLVLGIPRQHALDAHADTFHILHRAPSLFAQQV